MQNDLWTRYCSFYKKSFPEQVEENRKRLDGYVQRWRQSEAAGSLGKDGIGKFEDLPLTTYADYPYLAEFGEEMEKREKTVRRPKRETIWDYYQRISQPLAPTMTGWLTDEYAVCLKTSGSTAKPKWYAHGKPFLEAGMAAAVPIMLFACNDKWGDMNIRQGDTMLNAFAPLPFGSGMMAKMFDGLLKLMPPVSVLDNVPDMRKKIAMTLQYVEGGGRVDFMIGSPSSLKMFCDYFTSPEQLWKDRFDSFDLGIAKAVMYMKYLQAKSHRKYDRLKDILPAKGLLVAGWDGTVYLDYFREQFGIEPFNLYATSDSVLPMMGRPHRKFDLFPNLSNLYLEFLTAKGEVKKIQELTKNEVYEIVCTVFGSCTFRYRIGDVFRVIDFEADGTPIFRFESRTVGLIDVLNYYRISEALARDALCQSGFHSENWAICHDTNPKEGLRFLLEKETDYDEEHMSRLLFESLQNILPDFKTYVTDFKIKDPQEAVRVEYLKKGAFMRYMMRKLKQGVPFGQSKPPKVIANSQEGLANLLRTV